MPAKYVRFAAPYRSKTFNDKDALLIGRNGLMSGGEVSETGGIVTVQRAVVVQNGQIVDTQVSLSATLPTGLIAPYFVAISISTPIEIPGEIITPIFVKRPADINSQVVLIGEWDGTEWRSLPKLQIEERIKEQNLIAVQSGLVGVSSGMDISQDSTTFTIAPGTLIAADGSDIIKDEATTLTKVAVPASASSTHDRIDAIVFRKPADSPYRIGIPKLVVGPTFAGITGTVVETATTFSVAAPTQIKIKTLKSAAISVMAFKDGTTLKIRTVTDGFVSSSDLTIASGIDDYDFTENFDGSLDFVYNRTVNFYHKRVTTGAVVVFAESQLYTSTKILHRPAIACVGKATDYQLHIAVCKEGTGTAREIGYIRLESDATVLTPYVQWVDLTTQLTNLTFAKDDDDSELYLGFEDVDTGRAYLRTYDASTPTQTLPPTQIGVPVQLQDDTYNVPAAGLAPATGASEVKLVRTDNKELFAFWLHDKGGGNLSTAIYNSKYKSLYGNKALILDDTDILDYDVAVDDMNRGYFGSVLAAGSSVQKDVFELESLVRVGTSDSVQSGDTFTECGIAFSKRGDLLHAASGASTGKYYRSTAAVLTTLRTQTVCRTDVYLGYWRAQDGLLAVSDTLVAEDPSVRRLYDYNNMFGASGLVSWAQAGANKLVTTNITIRFLDRQATYTLPASGGGGFTVAAGSAIYVEIPDEDVSVNLTAKITSFGSGALDRLGKRAIPLFWNVGGRLFSNFAPYSFDPNGESAVIGSTISQELIDWLNCGDSAPDSSNHGYGSTFFIAESDGINTAIGKLDTALAAVGGGGGGLVPLSTGDTSVTVTFGSPLPSPTYRLSALWENTTDAEPMSQTLIVTAKDVNGFTVTWPSELDSNNYILSYLLS